MDDGIRNADFRIFRLSWFLLPFHSLLLTPYEWVGRMVMRNRSTEKGPTAAEGGNR
jgi:hypothetical protein